VQVAFAVPCPAAASLIAGIGGVFDARLTPGGASESLLTYRTRSPERTNPLVVTALAAAGAAIVSVTCSAATLEDVYARAVGPAAGTAAGGVT
jgi:hypothetical protein